MAVSAQNLDLMGERQSGQDVRTQNVMACQAVANIVKTSLGPVGLDKAMDDKVENQLEVLPSKELETKEGVQDFRRNIDQGTSLREDVQLLCQATNLLGKQMIFLEEDAETMIKEYQFWMKEHETYRVKLEEEQRATQEMLQVESSPLVNLEEEILQQQCKINCLKGQAHVPYHQGVNGVWLLFVKPLKSESETDVASKKMWVFVSFQLFYS